MKNILNNRGTTLIEVITAVVILGIIAVPLFNSISQTVSFNSSSDEAIRMNSTVQRIIEEAKATGEHDRYVYFDKRFNEVAASAAYYTLELKSENNSVFKNSDEYDRWDYDLRLHSDGKVSLHKNTGIKVDPSGTYGKLYQSAQVFAPQTMNSISLDFIGIYSITSPYICKYGPGASNYDSFTPGIGKINASDNTIVLNVVNEGISSNFDLSIINNTCYTSYPGALNLNLSELVYSKHVIVNLFNAEPDNDPDIGPKITLNMVSNYIDVNYKSEGSPHVENGNKITVEVKNNKGEIVKTVNSVIAKNIVIN